MLKTLTADREKAERQAIEAEAASKGKIIPLSVKGLPLDHFRKVVADLPAGQVPLDQQTPETVALAAVGGDPGDANAAQVRQLLGISDDDWKKHGK
jgi:hypothetical protein